MAKRKTQDKPKGKRAAQRDDGAVAIKRAEGRLARALAEVDAARDKVTRREHDLAALMERHGRTTASLAAAGDAIPLSAPSQPVSENGTAHADAELALLDTSEESGEQPAAADGAERHG